MQKVMTVGTTKLRKKSAVMKVGKRSTEKLIELLRTSQGEARAELVRKILRSVLLLGDRVCVDECAQLDSLTLRHVFNVLHHLVEVQIGCFHVIIAVLAHLQTRVLHDWNVISPGWIGNINVLVSVFVQELSEYSKTTSSGESLNTTDAIFKEWLGVLPKGKLQG